MIALTPDAREVRRRRSGTHGTGSSGYDAAIVFRHARLVHIVFSRWARIASASARELDVGELLEEDADRMEHLAHAVRLLRYGRSAPSQPMNG